MKLVFHGTPWLVGATLGAFKCVARSHLLMSMCAATSANQGGGGVGGGGEGGKWGGGGGEGRSSGLRGKKGGVRELRRERHLVRSS